MTHTEQLTTAHTPQPLTDAQLKQLMADLNQARIKSRKQGGATLSYLEAWDVKATLIRIFGFGGFSAEADDCEIVRVENNIPKFKGYGKDKEELPIEYSPDGQIKYGTANFRVTARVRVKLTIHQLGCIYSEFAASSQTGPDIGEVTDFAIKTAESDALKRAAIYLGTQFGLSLYNDGSTLEIVKVVLAPGQEWSRGARTQTVMSKEQARQEIARLEAILNGETPAPGERPAGAGGSVAHLRGDGVSDEDHQRNLSNIDNALSAKRKQPSADVPAALDRTLGSQDPDADLQAPMDASEGIHRN